MEPDRARARNRKRLRVGLTGGIASGKSMVAAELAARGAMVIDADVLAREVVEPGTPGLAENRRAVRSPDTPRRAAGPVAPRRDRLRRPGCPRDLERIVHPAVRARAAELERAADADAVVVHVIPLLVETGQQQDFDLVVTVDVDHETQIQRLISRNGYSHAAAEARIAAQASREDRRTASDVVLDNTGNVAQLREQIAALWDELTSFATRQ